VFAVDAAVGVGPPSASDLEQSWERLKASEKKRASLTDGVPQAQPALAYSAALIERTTRNGLDVDDPVSDEIGSRLFALVREAVAAGIDPETALRQTARAFRDAIKHAESVQ
jgi:XTP/dITP diphosphohydrolase